MRFWKCSAALAFLFVAACVTVNIYFPAAEVRQDAERVVKEAYGIEVNTNPQAPAPQEKPSNGGSMLELLGPAEAHAQDYANLNNAATRGAEQNLFANFQQVAPFFASGHVGVDKDGWAVLRSQEGLDMQQLAQLQRLLQQNRSLKGELYAAKAEAAGAPGKINEVQRIYADIWRQYAKPGWWVQDDNGAWRQK